MRDVVFADDIGGEAGRSPGGALGDGEGAVNEQGTGGLAGIDDRIGDVAVDVNQIDLVGQVAKGKGLIASTGDGGNGLGLHVGIIDRGKSGGGILGGGSGLAIGH